MPALGQVVNTYIEKKIGTGWNSPASIQNNTSTLKVFVQTVRDIAGVDPDLSDVDDTLVLSAIERRWPNNGENSTHQTNYSRVKSFFNWAGRKGYALGDLDEFTERKPVRPTLDKKYATREEVEKAAALLRARDYYRDAAFLEFQFESHRRAGELVAMRVKDVDLTPRDGAPHGIYWFKETKSGKGRYRLELTKEEASILARWLEDYARTMLVAKANDEWFLFPATIATGRTVAGRHRPKALIPTRMIGEPSKLMVRIWKLAGVYEKGKATHANRRGGMDEVFRVMSAAGIPDPLGLIMERSAHSNRSVAEAYLNRNETRRRSNAAYASIQRGTTPKVEEAPITAESTEGARVVSFAEFASRRSAG